MCSDDDDVTGTLKLKLNITYTHTLYNLHELQEH